MLFWLNKLTDLVATSCDESLLKTALEEIAHQGGFTGYAYLHLQSGRAFAMSNFDAEWQSIYFARKYFTVDPIVKRARSATPAFTWSLDLEWPKASKKERQFYDQAIAFGIRAGVTVPIRTAYGSTSLFTLASDDPDCVLFDVDPVAAAAAVGQLHALISILRATPTCENKDALDIKEITYLNWIAAGKSMGEVADIERVKYNSVRVKLDSARKRFDVHTTTHLAVLAVRKNLI
ncbi:MULTISPECIES: autoinducer-binding transcriptional regulator TraR [Agrobacterium tumefaciens complex]|jgi:LuxR family transcriptional activator of conjugal transfer of Ti plasmids|uniref:autoinducer-binding transcriptional regulator TraR n=1 Tax=Agrobacterium tumefaciens TaxID=358 RepID=UPI000FE2902B|nr:transcriptional regulator TraR [Agrobacterium tumefaciens]QAA98360.1 transcriptional regulator TraR [Agrobacterium tumefaciens]QAB01115.1 transcriptional regulator TraR [Agrobacterium tumefaciens]